MDLIGNLKREKEVHSLRVNKISGKLLKIKFERDKFMFPTNLS